MKTLRNWIRVQNGLIFVLLSVIVYTAIHCYISDSEFWAITIAKELFSRDTDQIGLYYKIPFYLLLKIPHLATDNISVLVWSRVLFAGILGLILLQSHRLARLVTRNRWSVYFYLFALLSTGFFVSQGMRVRSDMLSCLFFLNLILTYARARKNHFAEKSFLAKVFCWHTLMILTTPKSVFFTLSFIALTTFDYIGFKDHRRILLKAIAATASPILLGVFTFFSFHYRLSYQAAWDLFKNSSSEYLDFWYFKKFVVDNIPFAVFLFAGLICQGIKFFKSQDKYSFQSWTSLLSLSMVLVFLLHNQRLPFFIVSLLPIAGLVIIPFSEFILKKLNYKKFLVVNVFIVFFVTSSLVHAYKTITLNNNSIQFSVISELEKYIASQTFPVKYYDVIGILPKLKPVYAFVSPHDNRNDHHLQKLRKEMPDLIVYANRAFNMEPGFGQFLQNFYLNIGTDFWARALDNSRFATDKAISLREIKEIMSAQNLDYDRIYIYEYRPGKDLWHRLSTAEIFQSSKKKKFTVTSEIVFSDYKNLDDYKISNAKDRQFTIFTPIRFSAIRETGEIKRLFSYDREF